MNNLKPQIFKSPRLFKFEIRTSKVQDGAERLIQIFVIRQNWKVQKQFLFLPDI